MELLLNNLPLLIVTCMAIYFFIKSKNVDEINVIEEEKVNKKIKTIEVITAEIKNRHITEETEKQNGLAEEIKAVAEEGHLQLKEQIEEQFELLELAELINKANEIVEEPEEEELPPDLVFNTPQEFKANLQFIRQSVNRFGDLPVVLNFPINEKNGFPNPSSGGKFKNCPCNNGKFYRECHGRFWEAN